MDFVLYNFRKWHLEIGMSKLLHASVFMSLLILLEVE